ncbi:MAG TPA: 2-oxoglutarate dehydrogenase complex dihydrolipoyllysine-residue succinyltransferase [Ktedonobacterales bacterium]
MSTEVRVPSLGESIVEAVVGRWMKHEGDAVSEGDPLVELETDKVNMEVPAPAAGVLGSIAQAEGATVQIGDLLATIGEGAANDATPTATAALAQPAEAPATAQPVASHVTTDDGGGRATPLARRLADEAGVDVGNIPGTGTSGRVTQDDVTAWIASQRNGAGLRTVPTHSPVAAPSTPAPAIPTPSAPAVDTAHPREERVRLSRRRQTIAKRLVEAQHTAAMLTTFNEVDMTAIMAIRARRKESFKEKHGVGLGFMSFFTKAVLGALKAYPRLNAEIQGDEMVLKHHYDIGIAVSTDEGLVVPVVRDADRLSFAEIERQIGDLATRARGRTLTLEDLQGGTFTITNGGIFGSLLSTPILNGPQVGILGMHKIQERPIAVNGQVVIRPMMYVALSYDHRIVDGSEAVSFLVRVKELLEDPESLLLEG